MVEGARSPQMISPVEGGAPSTTLLRSAVPLPVPGRN